jgi:glutaredoxin-like YruB-family protein
MKIRVFSTPTCPWCHVVKQFLKERGFEYEEVDVSVNREAAKEMIAKSGQMGVPQTEINGKFIVGFDKPVLEAELAKVKGRK